MGKKLKKIFPFLKKTSLSIFYVLVIYRRVNIQITYTFNSFNKKLKQKIHVIQQKQTKQRLLIIADTKIQRITLI